MEMEVTKTFAKQFEKLTPQAQQDVLTAFKKLAENPQSVRYEEKAVSAKGLFAIRAEGGDRIVFAKNTEGNLIPAFVGKHDTYDRFLAEPNFPKSERLTGLDSSRLKTMELDIPEKLTADGVLGKTSFAIGNIKLRGVTGAIITGGVILGLGGTARDAVAGTTPGHIGVELAEGDVRGATEALIVDGAGDIGCAVSIAPGAKTGATIGAFFEGVGAIPGGVIGGIGGCLVGGLAASETAQALWNLATGDNADKTEIASPSDVLQELNEMGIRNVPDQVTADMPSDLKELVLYKNNVADSIETLNHAAADYNANKDSADAKNAFIEASAKFQEAAEAYKYSAVTMENPQEVQDYVYKIQAEQLENVASSPAVSYMPPPSYNTRNAVYANPAP